MGITVLIRDPLEHIFVNPFNTLSVLRVPVNKLLLGYKGFNSSPEVNK